MIELLRRSLGWLFRRLGPRTLLLVALLLVAMAGTALGLADAVRGLDAGLLLPFAGLGLLVGWGLAKSPLPGWLAALVVLGLGVEGVFLRVGRLGGPLKTLAGTLADALIRYTAFLLRSFWGLGRTGSLPDRPPGLTASLLALEDLWARANILLGRVCDWALATVTGRPTLDLVAVALVWSLALWAVAAWASYWVRRRGQPLPGMLPAGVLLSFGLFEFRGDPSFLLPLMGVSLFLVALMGHYTRQSRWEATGVDYPSDVGYEVTLAGAALSVVLVSLAVAIPSITVEDIREWARRLPGSRGRSSVIRVVSGSQGPDSGSSARGTIFAEDQILAPGLPRRHLLGSGPELSEQVVMVIYADQDTSDEERLTPVPSEPALGGAVPRYYWRGLTYDVYTGRGWITRRVETQEYQAGSLAIFRDPTEPAGVGSQADWSPPPGRRQVRAQVWSVAYLGNLLHAAGDLVTVDRAYRVAWRSQGDAFGANILLTGRPAGGGDTPTPSLDGDTQLAPGAGLEGSTLVYRTDSLVPAVGEAQLRAVGGDYPSWVQARYLALPEKIPARVSALARDLTATAPTPYDQALAIEAYLRTFPYSLDLPSPPNERDVVDYFLFDLQQGYCDYYATAMVVLARTAGLPARLAVGYASGTYDEANARYIVTEADAHAWVEIYFPGYGWIEFEPTAGRPPIHRPAYVPPVVPPDLEPLEPVITRGSRLVQLWWLGLLGMVLLLGLAFVAWVVIDGWRLRRLPSEMTVSVVYWRLNRLGRRLVGPVQPGTTPYEFAVFLVTWVRDKARARHWSAALMPAVQEAGWLTDLYVRTCYGPQPPDVIDQRQAIRIWQRLRRRLWLGCLLGR